jgi:mRNA-degrading endonuclease toxin of MazEF toxin-antitoxin module
VKSLDWRARKASRIGTVPEEVVAQVLQRLQTLLAGGGS